ncbi:heme/steroid binding domain protein [Aspergillus crustosus]
MSELRQRPVVPTDTPKPPTTTSRNVARTSSHGISILDILRLLAALVAVSCGLSYYLTSSESLLWGYKPWFTKWPQVIRYIKGPVNLTPGELVLYDGTNPSLPIYLAVNGTIFDVSANPNMYGPGGSYHFFAGRDATRAFVTGCFAEDLTDDLTGVEEMFIPIDEDSDLQRMTSGERKIRREQDIRSAKKKVDNQVRHWAGFFGNHKNYFEAGRVVKDGADGDGNKKGEKRGLCEAARKQRPKREKST